MTTNSQFVPLNDNSKSRSYFNEKITLNDSVATLLNNIFMPTNIMMNFKAQGKSVPLAVAIT